MERERPGEINELAAGLSKTFIQRWDLYSMQKDNGRYVCIHSPLNVNHVVDHLNGKITLASYLLDENNNARFTVIDADDDYKFDQLMVIAEDLGQRVQPIPSYLEMSRRGGHMWFFFEHEVSGIKAKNFGIGLMKKYHLNDVEVFPKQGKSEGPGSSIRLPFGVHRRSGRTYNFVTPFGGKIASYSNQMKILINPKKVPMEFVDMVEDRPKKKVKVYDLKNPSLEKIKSVDLTNFIGEYVELNEISGGAIGMCPFHEDHNPSFGINKERNYWHCFAGCGGGSIIDFWMKWQKIDLKTAVEELDEQLRNRNTDSTRSSEVPKIVKGESL